LEGKVAFQKKFNKNEKGENKYLLKKKKRVCAFCSDKAEAIDYKDGTKLQRYISERGKILPRRVTGVCAMHQRDLTVAIKRARQLAILPYVIN
jgi:small subunit ribosomal protein S18